MGGGRTKIPQENLLSPLSQIGRALALFLKWEANQSSQ
jgi:hypothetical protein